MNKNLKKTIAKHLREDIKGYRKEAEEDKELIKKLKTNKRKKKMARKKQGYDARLDESLGMRRGKESGKKQSMKARRDESKGMEKAMGRKSYASVKTMDKGKRKKK